ncbi:carboxymuconolactone decarboxylase family protein [Rhodococcus sp. CX]|uniref:carboxymuconolactone decarboxylase family protein n=1 Tax=Rhodococcus sp. CX TaxID=2789880 RepID=UPI001E29E4A5|nr:carboxymuconolactone decarboxylase family protein [Rhodococcus sp. CX]
MTHNHRHAPLGADLAPEMGAAVAAFNSAVFTGPGDIPRKYRELIAIAVALTTQCESCIRFHTEDALALGATEEELAEVTYIAAAMRSGGALVHGMKALSVAARSNMQATRVS